MINEKSDKELLSLANAVGMSPSEFLTNHQSVLQVHILSDNLKWRDDSNVFQDCDDQESFGEVCPPKSISPSASSAGLQVNFILNWNSGLENLTIIVGFIAPQCGVHMLLSSFSILVPRINWYNTCLQRLPFKPIYNDVNFAEPCSLFFSNPGKMQIKWQSG